jgi:Domain of unknown function (DUF4260)
MPATLPLPHRPLTRSVVLLAGLAAQAGAIALIGPWSLALWLVPDIALLAGASREFAQTGRLHPRAVRLYNVLHAVPGPVALIAVGALVSPTALGIGLVWLSHVAVDRAAGYGLRAPDGSIRG